MRCGFSRFPLIVAAWLIHARTRAGSGARPCRRSSPPVAADDVAARAHDHGALAVVASRRIVFALMRPQMLREIEHPAIRDTKTWSSCSITPRRWAHATCRRRASAARSRRSKRSCGTSRTSSTVSGSWSSAGTSLILSHLTRDIDSLTFYLDWIRESPEVRFGTDIGAALASARELVRKDDRETTKVFLVISDGADQGSALAKELAAVRDERTRIYAIGIGSDPNAVVPAVNEDGVETLLRRRGRPAADRRLRRIDASRSRRADRRPLRALDNGRRPADRAAGSRRPRAAARVREARDRNTATCIARA